MFSELLLHPAKVFQACCPHALATPLPPPFVSWRSDPGRSRSLSFSGLSRAGSLRVVLRASRPRGRAAPGRLLPPQRSASRLAPPGPGGPRFTRRYAPRPRWSRLLGGGGRRSRDLSPACTQGPSGRPLVPCDHGVTTNGGTPPLCGLGSGRGRVRAPRRDLVIDLV